MAVRHVARQVEVSIAHGLQLADDTQHLVHLALGLIRQTAVSYLVQVSGYLNLHSVAYTFVLLDTRVYLHKLLLLAGVVQIAHHIDHPTRTDTKYMYLMPSLHDRELGGGHQATGDELQRRVFVAIGLRR